VRDSQSHNTLHVVLIVLAIDLFVEGAGFTQNLWFLNSVGETMKKKHYQTLDVEEEGLSSQKCNQPKYYYLNSPAQLPNRPGVRHTLQKKPAAASADQQSENTGAKWELE
jgi:hypothetical protein